MVMVGLKTRGEVPFRDVFLTATVCDKQGRKFSKTLGNGIDPRDVVERFGTDAVRFTAVQLAPLGGRIRMSEEDFESGGRFVNKLWNASRFLLSYLKDGQKLKPLKAEDLDLPSKWLLTELSLAAENVDRSLSQYRINDAADHVYHVIWGSFCDWALETTKNTLNGNDQAKIDQTLSVLVYVLDGLLRLASPIMPFLSEEIWHKLPHHPDWDRPESLVIAKFPEASRIPRFPEESAKWRSVQEIVAGIRSVRSQAGIPPRTEVKVFIRADEDLVPVLATHKADICRLAFVTDFVATPTMARPGQCLVTIGRGYEAYIPAEGLLDVAKEQQRLKGEIARIEKIVAGLEGKLKNPSFVDRAPADVVEQTKSQCENMTSQLAQLRKSFEALA
jgi:valyl-tRNA synthetase